MMAFIIRRPFIYIVIAIVCVVLIIQFSRSFTPSPHSEPELEIASITQPESSISANQNTTLTLVLENTGTKSLTAALRIIYTPTDKLRFYDSINRTLLPEPHKSQQNHTIYYPKTMIMQPKEKWTAAVIVEGLDPGQPAYTYIIILEAWMNGEFSDREEVQLTVTHA